MQIFPTTRTSVAVCALCCLTQTVFAQARPDTQLAAARAMESALVESIAIAERSVVAIARGRRGDRNKLADPKFVPFEYSTGVVVDAGGLVLTNYHSLGDVKQNDYVVWIGGKAYERVNVKAADPWTDLAVLDVNTRNLTPIRMGTSAGLRKGRIVIALGNPHAIARDGNVSATWGIVSSLSRKVDGPLTGNHSIETVTPADRETRYHFGGLIQTDAKLARGTSGGPLLDLEGKMIGLSTNVAMLAGFEKGMGYAIPVDTHFRRVLEKLKRGEEVEQGFLGVAPRNPVLDDGEVGIVLADVKAGTPAAVAGMSAWDQIVQIDDVPVSNVDDLFLLVGSLPPNHVANFRVLRASRELTVPVKLSKKPRNASRPMIATAKPRSWRGLRVDYSTALSTMRIASLDPRGCVIVVDVEENSPAWNAGIRVGAVISRIAGKRVSDPDQFFAVSSGESGAVTAGIFGQKTVIISE